MKLSSTRVATPLPPLIFTLTPLALAQTPKFAQHEAAPVVTTAYAAKCVGTAHCRACQNCCYCKHYAKKGGTCGVCRRRRHSH